MINDEMRDNKVNIKYEVENFDILFENGDIEEITSEMVRYLYIEKDYESLYFPLINISIVMDDLIYHRIKQENDTVQFRVRIVKNIYNIDKELIKYELFCNKTFRCFMDKENVIKDRDLVDKKRVTDDAIHPGYIANPREFYLFLDSVIDCKKKLNISVANANLTDLIVYLFNQRNVDKLLMSKLDNQMNVSNLIIPHGNLIENLIFLDETLGFYKKGMMLYFDIDNAYLIDKNSACTSWRRNEVRITHIHVANNDSSDSQLNGQYVDKERKQCHLFSHNNRLEIKNSNIINDQMKGNEIALLNAKTNSVDSISASTTQIGNPNTHLVNSKYSTNGYTNEIIKTRLKESEIICRMSFLGIDIDVFSPNKEIIITFEDPEMHSKYSGSYRILTLVSTLKKDAQELVGEVQVTLAKQE
jgi:hypothetical protein